MPQEDARGRRPKLGDLLGRGGRGIGQQPVHRPEILGDHHIHEEATPQPQAEQETSESAEVHECNFTANRRILVAPKTFQNNVRKL